MAMATRLETMLSRNKRERDMGAVVGWGNKMLAAGEQERAWIRFRCGYECVLVCHT